MITNRQSNILVSFDDGWTEILVTVSDNKISLATKVFKHVAMVLREVGHGRTRLEETFELYRDIEQTVLE